MTKKPPIRMNKLQIFYFHDFSGGGGSQARVQECKGGGGAQNLKTFFFCFSIF